MAKFSSRKFGIRTQVFSATKKNKSARIGLVTNRRITVNGQVMKPGLVAKKTTPHGKGK